MNDFQKSSKRVKSDLNTLEQVLSWFDQLKPASISKKDWLQCQLALAEGFTNAVRHAHKDLSQEVSIDLEVTLGSQYLELRIWDQGPPFDLEQWLQDHQHAQDDHAGGGRGIVILKKIADQLSYTRTADHRNCLLIVKRY